MPKQPSSKESSPDFLDVLNLIYALRADHEALLRVYVEGHSEPDQRLAVAQYDAYRTEMLEKMLLMLGDEHPTLAEALEKRSRQPPQTGKDAPQ